VSAFLTPLNDLADGETTTMQGSGKKPYTLKNVGGVYSCSCPAWLHQSLPIDIRTCKHLRKLRGDAVETARTGTPGKAKKRASKKKKAAAKKLATHAFALAETYEDEDHDPKGMLMSEKLDGVRAKWIGKERIFISRGGNQFFAPDWFTADLPNEDLDGELFMGRKLFSKTSGIARRKNGGEEWKKLRFHVFDVPSMQAGFDARIALVHTLIKGKAFAVAVKHTKCRGKKHLAGALDRMVALGGEGLILRDTKALYEGRRSVAILKVRKWYDAEATVVGYDPGKGRHKGRMGAMRCVMPDGKEFGIGTGFSDEERDSPPWAVGTVVTYKYRELNENGIPRHSSFRRVREED
jgi:DNA ligase-1